MDSGGDGVAVVKQSVDQALQVAEFLGLERSILHEVYHILERRQMEGVYESIAGTYFLSAYEH